MMTADAVSVHDDPAERLLPKQAAEYLRCRYSLRSTEGHLNQLRHQGRGPAYLRVGRWIIYRRSDLDAWVAAQTVRITSEAG
jgi:hypothetical protein